jgi:galactonate dehydratase
MKITSVRTFVVGNPWKNWLFLKVDTDEGVSGLGEATGGLATKPHLGDVEELTRFVVGQDPRNPEALWHRMLKGRFLKPSLGMSGIEIACWDILGKSLGVPVYRLLGGAVRDRVRMYTHLGGGEADAVYSSFEANRIIELACQVVERGYTALKVVCVPFSEPLVSPPSVKAFAAAIERLRLAVGDAVDIMIDFHGRTWPAAAIQYINAVAEYQPFFCEEPVPPGNVGALAEITRAVRVPIATGERLVSRYEFREIFEQRACHVIQPDLCHCGGLLEGRKIAAMAETYFIGVAPHNPLGPIANAVALHFALSTPNFVVQEDMLADVPWRWEVVHHSLNTRDGYWLPVETPGLGIEVDEQQAARHPFQQEKILTTTARAPDGAILDF